MTEVQGRRNGSRGTGKGKYPMSELFAHSGAWGLALITIVLVSWMFYRYFAPESWREWAGAGLVGLHHSALRGDVWISIDDLFSGAVLWVGHELS